MGRNGEKPIYQRKRTLEELPERRKRIFYAQTSAGETCWVAADFKAAVMSSFRDSLSRQVSEGVPIRHSSETVLKSKAEWHQPALWRVRQELSKE